MSETLVVETSPVMTLAQQSEASRALRGGNEDPSPHQLLHFAIERNLPVESLERIVALAERMQDRSAAREFAEAMAAFQKECPSIKKTSTANIATRGGGKFSYTYADLDEIASVVNPVLARHGLSYSFDSKLDKDFLTCICTVRHVNGHSVPSTFTLPTASESAMSAQQKVGAALTFAKRQSLSAALGITTTDDDTDAQHVSPQTISEDAAIEIEELITETGSNRERFLDFMGVRSVPEIRAADYQRAIHALKRKQEKAR
jgi:hypothetical protein